jgi:catechol 2,3-dioxygenase-like lactoylglutathione lyase family enzyme
MLLGVHHVAIASADLDRLRDFYCNLLGMEQIAQGEWEDEPEMDAIVGLPGSAARYMLLRAGNFSLELFQYDRPRSIGGDADRPVSMPGITHFCFAVSDLDGEYERLKAAGVRFHGPPPQRTADPSEQVIRAVYARDPDGNVLELLEIVGETPFDYVPATPIWRQSGH